LKEISKISTFFDLTESGKNSIEQLILYNNYYFSKKNNFILTLKISLFEEIIEANII